ncbi:alpha/beta fold hydrolase [Halobacteriovorax sp. XZX-3]|uniref:YheT family hydrolase n=1 Tax=unclassified Halobacteriovorax TaxID=2639665 RepID=UPI00371D6ACE
MPVIESRYTCHQSLQNGHLQTIIPFFIRRTPRHKFEKRTLTTPDGDFLRYYRSTTNSPLENKHLIIISHGLEGNGRDRYIVDMMKKFNSHGYDVISWDMRSCGGALNRTKKFYNAQDYHDLKFLVDNVSDEYEHVSLMGISLGGAITANYLGRHPEVVNHKIYRGFILSSPMDLNGCSVKLKTEISRHIYRHVFVYSMRKKVIEKAKVMELPVDLDKVKSIKHIDDFDEYVTAPIYGYRDGNHYREEASPISHLEKIRVPFYILNAYDDPFLSEESYPYELAQRKSNLYLEVPKNGGHVGFIKSPSEKYYWYEHRILNFLKMKL